MRRAIFSGLMVLVCSAGTPAVAQAQFFGGCFDCCWGCPPPPVNCAAPPATTLLPPLTQSYVQPVVSTQYRQQQQITYQDVPQTEYRQEAYYENVPVTTYENVTVDEGGYQQVWVPKLVTKTVAKQAQQTRLSYRSVPYQVTRRVPQISTSLVPEQRISYQSTQTTTYLPPVTTTWQTPVYSSAYTASLLPPLTTPIVSTPITAPLASRPAPRTAEADHTVPVPDPEFESRSTSIPRRTAARDPYDGYRPASRKPVRSAKRFVPAPSAASVWQTPRGSVYR